MPSVIETADLVRILVPYVYALIAVGSTINSSLDLKPLSQVSVTASSYKNSSNFGSQEMSGKIAPQNINVPKAITLTVSNKAKRRL